MHTFLPEQPDLNWRNPEVRAALIDVVRTWLDRGVDGLPARRLQRVLQGRDCCARTRAGSVAGAPGRWQRHVHDRDQPELAGALAELRALVDELSGHG